MLIVGPKCCERGLWLPHVSITASSVHMKVQAKKENYTRGWQHGVEEHTYQKHIYTRGLKTRDRESYMLVRLSKLVRE